MVPKPPAPDRRRDLSRLVPSVLVAGLRLAARHWTLVLAAYVASLVGAFVPSAAAVRALLASTAHGFTPAASPRGLEGALAQGLLGDLHLEQWIGLATFAVLWIGTTGGTLAHLARDGRTPASLGSLTCDGARLLPPLLVMSALAAAAAVALGQAHASMEGHLATRLELWESERAAAAARAGLGLAFLGAVAVASTVMRYARVDYVVGPDPGIVRGIAAGLRILRQHPASVLGLQTVAWAGGLLLIAAFSWLPLRFPAEAGLGRAIVVLAVGQAAAFLHAGLRIGVVSAEFTLWRRLGADTIPRE